jgi:putative Mn2+ efflux pump MntP
VTALFIALGVPIDTQAWDSGLNMVSGYSMFLIIEIGTFLFSTVSFFIAAWSRGSREYAYIGAGAVLVFLGRNILLKADTWVGAAAGPVCLAVGTWLICKNLHKIYLWL